MSAPELQRRIRRIVSWIVLPAVLVYQVWVRIVRIVRKEG